MTTENGPNESRHLELHDTGFRMMLPSFCSTPGANPNLILATTFDAVPCPFIKLVGNRTAADAALPDLPEPTIFGNLLMPLPTSKF